MAAIFLKLLNLSISASWLVLAVLILRLGSKRSPKWMNVLLWGHRRTAAGPAVFH